MILDAVPLRMAPLLWDPGKYTLIPQTLVMLTMSRARRPGSLGRPRLRGCHTPERPVLSYSVEHWFAASMCVSGPVECFIPCFTFCCSVTKNARAYAANGVA